MNRYSTPFLYSSSGHVSVFIRLYWIQWNLSLENAALSSFIFHFWKCLYLSLKGNHCLVMSSSIQTCEFGDVIWGFTGGKKSFLWFQRGKCTQNDPIKSEMNNESTIFSVSVTKRTQVSLCKQKTRSFFTSDLSFLFPYFPSDHSFLFCDVSMFVPWDKL